MICMLDHDCLLRKDKEKERSYDAKEAYGHQPPNNHTT